MKHTKHTQKSTRSTLTIGIDLGDKSHETCSLNDEGEVLERSSVLNHRDDLIAFSRANRGATLIMEAGCHSPWISRLFQERGHKVIVAKAAGEKTAKKGAKVAKKKAVVKTARKLAVIMLALWKDPDAEYRPFPNLPIEEDQEELAA